MNRPLVLLGIGAATGLALATAGILSGGGGDRGRPDDAVASVNGVPLPADQYRRLLVGLESDLGRSAAEDERRRLLDRMIEEELLVQRGLELGLARHDRQVRADLVAAVIDAVVSEAEVRAPTEAELRAFHTEHAAFFARPARQRVRQIFFAVREGDGGAEARPHEVPPHEVRAHQARARLVAGEAFEAVRRRLGDETVVEVPDVLLPPAKLREYVGPTALEAALDLEVGGVSEPLRSGGGLRLIELVEREPARVPAYEEVEPLVRTEWRRQSGERALRAYLDGLRGRARVDAVDTLP